MTKPDPEHQAYCDPGRDGLELCGYFAPLGKVGGGEDQHKECERKFRIMGVGHNEDGELRIWMCVAWSDCIKRYTPDSGQEQMSECRFDIEREGNQYFWEDHGPYSIERLEMFLYEPSDKEAETP